MPKNDFIKTNENWIMLRRVPFTCVYLASMVVMTIGVVSSTLGMPKYWRSEVWPKVERMQTDIRDVKDELKELKDDLMPSSLKGKKGQHVPHK